jgi:membrane protein required for colicin V production
LVIFVIVYLLVKLLEGILHRVLDKIHLEKLDRVLGFFLGLAEGGLAVVLLVYLMHVQPIFDLQALLDNSTIARFVLEIIPATAPAQAAGGTVDV